MKTDNKILLYDDYCPLCTWYSGLFVKFGLLHDRNRIAFSKAAPSVLTAIDIEKGKDEIPLFDPATNRTVYGIDALLEILGQGIPLIGRIGNIKPVNWFLKKTYKLISYNRKVIVARKCGPGIFDCSPEFNSLYRTIFIAFFLVFNSLMLLPLHDHFLSHLSFYHLNSLQLQVAHFIFIGINCFLAIFLGRITAFEYIGQVTVLALVCVLLASTLMLINSAVMLPDWLILFCLVLVTCLITKEYFRRMKYAAIIATHKPVVIINIICLSLFLSYLFH